MEDKLRTLQLTQLEMLKTFDCFCREHNLHYSLYAGTMLGAIRHKAFIPWDDDLDVCMSREEYNRPLHEAAYRHLKEKADGSKKVENLPTGNYTVKGFKLDLDTMKPLQ